MKSSLYIYILDLEEMKIKKKWIIINLETKSREFKAKVLLAKKLAEYNYGVILINFRHLKEIKGLPKGLFLDRNILSVRKKVISEIKNKGFKFVCMDEEGLVYLNEEKYLRDRVPEETFELVDKFFCWGKEQETIIKNRHPKFISKLAIVGNPRIDLLRNEYKQLSLDHFKKIEGLYKPYILIVSNFTGVNMLNTPSNDEERYKYHLDRQRKLKLVSTSQQEQDFYNHYCYLNKLFNYFIKLPSKLAQHFPEYTIIVRPHPSEDHNIWKRAIKEIPNAKVIYEGALETWIKGSDLVINNSCTSSIESLIMNKNCVSYRPIKNEKYDQPLPNAVTKNVSTESEIIEIIENIKMKKNEPIFTDKQKEDFIAIIKNHIFIDARRNSVDNMKDEIDKLDLSDQSFNRILYKMNNLNIIFKLKLFLAFILYMCNLALTLNIKSCKKLISFYEHYKWNKAYEDHKSERIEKREILELLKEMDMDSSEKFKVTKMKQNTFIISK